MKFRSVAVLIGLLLPSILSAPLLLTTASEGFSRIRENEQLGVLRYATAPQRTAAETGAGVVPVNYQYPEGNALRYGDNTTPGTTDMTSAIQDALDSSDDVHIPCGTYLITQVTLSSNTSLHGDGRCSVLTSASDDYLVHAIEKTNIQISDLRFVGDASSKNVQHGISLEGVSDFLVTDNSFFQLSGRGIRMSRELDTPTYVRNGVVTRNVIENVGDVGIFLKSGLDIVISNNVIDRVGAYGGSDFAIGIVVDDGSGRQAGVISERVVVSDNIVRNLVGDDTSRGINITGTRDILVAGNLLENIGISGKQEMPGIRIASGGLTPDNPNIRVSITGNHLNGLAGVGITIEDLSDGYIARNDIMNYGANTASANAAAIEIKANVDTTDIVFNRIHTEVATDSACTLDELNPVE